MFKIISRILTILFWIFLILSIIATVLMAIPLTALFLRIFLIQAEIFFQFLAPLGFQPHFPLMASTNLWWVLLLAVPFIRMSRSRPIAGLAISGAAYAAILLIPPQIIKIQSDQMLAQALSEKTSVQNVGPVSSVTITTGGCATLCQQLLMGGVVTTVRVAAPDDNTLPRLMYQNLPAEECRALDPTFPVGAPCLLARLDDGTPSELIFEHERMGSRALKRKDVGFTPNITLRELTTLKLQETGDIVASQTRLIWIEPVGYVPLRSNTGFDGNGVHGGGLVPAQRKHEDPVIDPSAMLLAVGVPFSEPRGEVVVKKSWQKASNLSGYPQPAAYDVALIRSMFELGGLKNQIGGHYLSRWAAQFTRYEIVPDAQERSLINQIYESVRPVPHELSLMKRKYPNYFKGGLSALYVDIRSDDGSSTFDATNGIAYAALRQTPEQNAPQAEAYLGLMRDGIVPSRMVALAGRFTFDPVPVLRDYLKNAERGKIWPSTYVFTAACRADRRWAEQLVPLVVDTVRSLPPTRSEYDRNGAYLKALNALSALEQREAWEALQKELGPDIMAGLSLRSFGDKRCRD
ncbi:MAG: hypothetical protein V3U96_03895 [Paracoccaceae bacterium]